MKWLTLQISAGLLVVGVSALQADTIHVPGDQPTIQAGINAAVDGDHVEIAPGVYHEYGIDFLGKAITVRSEDPQNPQVVLTTVVTGDSLGGVFYFQSDEDTLSVLSGLTIIRASTYAINIESFAQPIDPSPVISNCVIAFNYEGGIRCHGDAYSYSFFPVAEITNCIVYANYGSGISIGNFLPHITDCVISGNRGTGIGLTLWEEDDNRFDSGVEILNGCVISGNGSSSPLSGGIWYEHYVWGHGIIDIEITDCLITGNTGIWAGGLYCELDWTAPIFTHCTFSNNRGRVSGGIRCTYFSDITLIDCTISGNSADSDSAEGGGVSLDGGDIHAINSIFRGNSGYLAGAISATDGRVTLDRCTITDNVGFYAGGIYSWGDYTSINFDRCTVTDNAGFYTGGIYSWSNGYYYSSIINAILWNNSPNELYLLYGDVTYSDIEGGWTGEGNIDEDPMFVLADKQDYRLLWESPCIDTGHPDSLDADGTRSDMGANCFNQNDYLMLYVTPDATEVLPGDELGVTYTAINRWDSPEVCWLLTQVRRHSGTWLNLLGPKKYTLPPNYTAQVHITHPVPNSTPTGIYEYRSLIGMPPGTLYDSDTFKIRVVE